MTRGQSVQIQVHSQTNTCMQEATPPAARTSGRPTPPVSDKCHAVDNISSRSGRRHIGRKLQRPSLASRTELVPSISTSVGGQWLGRLVSESCEAFLGGLKQKQARLEFGGLVGLDPALGRPPGGAYWNPAGAICLGFCQH